MKTTKALLTLSIAGAALHYSSAYAQDATALPEVTANAEKIPPPVRIGTGINAGETVIGTQEVQIRTPGSGDVNQLLKIIPSVQFERNEGIASRGNIQDLRPADISIAGGLFYENLITLDGIGVSSRVDVSNQSAQSVDELAGSSAQMLWLDAELIGKMTLRDSNVSAEFGNFSGGMLAIETRDPRRTFGITGSASYTGDGLTHMKLSKTSRDAIGSSMPPLKPEFDKWRYGATVDLPLGPNAALLIAYNRSEATVVHYSGPAYRNTPRSLRSISDNLLVRGVYDIDNATKLKGQFVYSPYTSESSTAVAVNSTVLSKGGGYTGKVELDHASSIDWNMQATYSKTDTGRTAPQTQYSIPSTVQNGAVCSSANCTIGGFGDINQNEEIYGYKARMGTDLGAVRLNAGLSYEHIGVLKTRPGAVLAYSRGVTGTNISCADGNSMECVTGQYALTQYNLYRDYVAKVNIDTVGVWTEAEAELGQFTVRPGLRYDYDSFLGNHVVAPRLAVSYALPWEGWEISVGANRYYGMSTASYALRALYPSTEIYTRTAVTSSGRRIYSNTGWNLNSVTNANSYRNGGLKTPYSDELTAAVTGDLVGGSLRLKAIYRDGKNAFVRSPLQNMVVDNGNGTTTTRRFFEMTNDGTSSFHQISAEWMRSFGKHSVGISIDYSRAKTRYTEYFENIDDAQYEAIPVLFEGNLIASTEIASMNRRGDYGVPFKVAASWTTQWINDRLRTNLTGNFRTGFRRIEDTSRTQIVDGVRYDVYDWKNFASSLDFDLNIQADLIRSRFGTLTLDARIENLIDSIPVRDYASATEPYQFGRSAWLGLKFRY